MLLLEKYIRRQTTDDFFWVVVDDVWDTEKPERCDLFIRREPQWDPAGGPTMLKNLAAAFRAIEHMGFDLILFIEDDDWYHPSYIETMQRRIMEQPPEIKMIGENYHKYYNVAVRTYMINGNNIHAALCATGVRGDIIQECIHYCENDIYQFFDFWLWKKSGIPGALYEGDLVVGIKSLPGRVGIGLGHHKMFASQRCRQDPGLDILIQWIDTDAYSYVDFYDPDIKVQLKKPRKPPAPPRRKSRASSAVITQLTPRNRG